MPAQYKNLKLLALLLLCSAVIPTSCGAANGLLPEPGSSAGKIINVRKGGDFQAALDSARSGDTIQLEAGATFKGAFVLPKKGGSEFITIRSSASDDDLPRAGERLAPEQHGAALPKLISNVKGKPTILAAN